MQGVKKSSIRTAFNNDQVLPGETAFGLKKPALRADNSAGHGWCHGDKVELPTKAKQSALDGKAQLQKLSPFPVCDVLSPESMPDKKVPDVNLSKYSREYIKFNTKVESEEQLEKFPICKPSDLENLSANPPRRFT